jgi:diguanylate cyclase (GGDEF)-like protein/PAS domain S-box-containing protein
MSSDRENPGIEEIRLNRAFLTTLIDNAPVAIFVKDVRPETYGTMVVWNKRIEAITGMAEQTVVGRKDEDILTTIVLDEMRKRDREMLANPIVQEIDDDPYRRRDGVLIFLHTISVPLFGSDGRPEFIMRISEDVTARRRQRKELEARTVELIAMSEALKSSEHRLRTITDAMPAGIAYIDRHQVYQFINAEFERAFGRAYGSDPKQVLGRTVREVVGEAMYPQLEPHIGRALAGETVTFERERSGLQGAQWIESTYIPEFNEHGDQVVGFHAMMQDISAKKLEQLRLVRLSQIDALTGLANRVGFEQRLFDAMESARITGEPLALMYVDIDHFKQINDTHGHAAGDALLVEFANRLKSLMRKSDIVARVGGDEFVIVNERVLDPGVATKLAAKILAATQRPFVVDSEKRIEWRVTASIGIAFSCASGKSPDDVLDEADSMLYAAKKNGRNQYLMAQWPCADIPARPREPPG